MAFSLIESQVQRALQQAAESNRDASHLSCFLGAGAYHHWIPSAVNHIVGRSEFYTAYTPYQPEISQGTLQAIFEFQSWICKLTGMDVSNASLYDGATALAEAALMALRIHSKRNQIILANAVHPAYRQVLETYLEPHGCEIMQGLGVGDWGLGGSREDNLLSCHSERSEESVSVGLGNENTAAIIIQNPSFRGDIVPQKTLTAISDAAKRAGALVIICVDPISLGLLPKPSEYGADIVVGEGQSLGLPLNYGGPYLGLMACRSEYLRQMPGRIVGETVDTEGRRAFVLTMQTREQHIRREKATSNICSNQALCALAATVYLSLVGEDGLKEVAALCKRNADILKAKLSAIPGVTVVNTGETFKEFAVKFSAFKNQPPAVGTVSLIQTLNKKLLDHNILGGYELAPDTMLIAVTEMITDEAMERFVGVVKGMVQ